jgi:DNA polymerase III subunit epsilon
VSLFRRKVPLGEARWLVIDCETSGLDAARDRLLSVGAVAAQGARILLGEAHAALVRQASASAPQNILVHGIGADAQRSGRPQAEVIDELERLIGEATPVGYHAPFDAAVLQRAGLRRRRWLDLEPLAQALHPGERHRTTLDQWLEHFGIEHAGRHDALLDALATAELLLVLLAAAQHQGARSIDDVLAAAHGRRWLAPR